MDDIEDSSDLGKFLDEEDDIKPIDIDRKASEPSNPDPFAYGPMGARKSQEPAKEEPAATNPASDASKPELDAQNPAPDASNSAPDSSNPAPETPNPAPEVPNPVPEGSNPAPETPPLEGEGGAIPPGDPNAVPDPFANPEDEADSHDINFVNKGEYVDLIEKVPTLKRMLIGAGWSTRSFEGGGIDVDISLFLLNKYDKTREDEDFVFYNNDKACGGAVHHLGDSRSGAGDGDDENIFIDVNGIPFDIIKIVFVFSIYDPEMEGHHFGQVKNMFLRIVNKDDGHEVMRYQINDQDHRSGNALIVGTMIREGPKWIFEADAQISNGGLAKVATDYDIVVKELQSTGDNEVGEGVDKMFEGGQDEQTSDDAGESGESL